MATLAEIARQRKGDLRSLMLASRKLDAAQELVEREAKRLLTRKRAVPEAEDAERLLRMLADVAKALANIIAILEALSRSWT